MPQLWNLAVVIKAKGMTQEEVANKAKLTTKTVWSAVKGKSVTFKTAKKIAGAVGVKVDKL